MAFWRRGSRDAPRPETDRRLVRESCYWLAGPLPNTTPKTLVLWHARAGAAGAGAAATGGGQATPLALLLVPTEGPPVLSPIGEDDGEQVLRRLIEAGPAATGELLGALERAGVSEDRLRPLRERLEAAARENAGRDRPD